MARERKHMEEEAEQALVALEEIVDITTETESRGEDRDDVLLYEPKPLYLVREEKDERGTMILRNYIQAAMWGIPCRQRLQMGFLQRGRLSDLRHLSRMLYDCDFSDISWEEFVDDIRRFKGEPLLRPRIPSMLNPQLGESLLNYMLKQMERLGMDRLIIYEVWGGNGTTALTILDTLAEKYPKIYERCEYHMVDVLGLWMTHRDVEIKAHHFRHYFEHHVSFFDWEVLVKERVFFLCLECLSYLPLDCVEVLQTEAGHTSFYETWVREVHVWDDRQFVDRRSPVNKVIKGAYHRPLQDPLILEYLRHIDFDGFFTPSAIQKHLHHNVHSPLQETTYGGRADGPTPIKPMMMQGNYNARRSVIGALDTKYWIPSLLVPFFDKLRRYFPRHTLVLLDDSGIHSYVTGRDSPAVRQYAMAKIWDIEMLFMNENSFGRQEIRANLNFGHIRELYYKMLELPPHHPLHLRCLDVPSFFREYGTPEHFDSLIKKDLPAHFYQPIDCFPSARFLVSEYSGDEAEVGDKPADAAFRIPHIRHSFYNKVWKVVKMLRMVPDESSYELGTIDVMAQRNQLLDTTAVKDFLGPNPTPEKLGEPFGWKDRDSLHLNP